jgi:hypothetical protein
MAPERCGIVGCCPPRPAGRRTPPCCVEARGALAGLIGPVRALQCAQCSGSQVRSGLVLSEVYDNEGHKAAFAASEVTSFESSYARIFRDRTAEPRGRPQGCAASSWLVHKGAAERPLFQLRKSRNLFHRPVKQRRANSNLHKFEKLSRAARERLGIGTGPVEHCPHVAAPRRA